MKTTLTEPQLTARLKLSLRHSGVALDRDREARARLMSAYGALVGRGHTHVPLSLVADLEALLTLGDSARFRSQRELEAWADAERAARLRYESALLGRLLQLPQLRELIELGRTGALVGPPLTRAIELLLIKLSPHYPRELSLHPSHLRLASPGLVSAGLPNDEALESLERSLSAELGAELSELRLTERFLDALSHSLSWGELISEVDLFELRHWSRLNSEDLRLGCRQLMEVERRFGPIDPRGVTLPREDDEADSAFTDDTLYPTGGITELTTSGAWENLVLSELIYIDDERPDEVDLFDLRFVENELLFYLRDEGQLSSKRRLVAMVIDLGDLFTLSTPGYEHQFSIWVMGLLLSVTRDLCALYPNDALRFQVTLLTSLSREARDLSELRLLELLLADEVQQGLISFQCLQRFDEGLLHDPKRKGYALVICDEGRVEGWRALLTDPRAGGQAPLSALTLSVSSVDAPLLKSRERVGRRGSYAELSLPLKGLDFEQLSEVKRWLVTQLSGGQRREAVSFELINSGEEGSV